MAFKIGKRKFPMTLAEILADKALFEAGFYDMLERRGNEENYMFIKVTDRGMGRTAIYRKFFAPNTRYELNVDSDAIKGIRAFAQANDWTHRLWVDLLDIAYRRCLRQLTYPHTEDMRSKEYF